jgi:hypothetical protein
LYLSLFFIVSLLLMVGGVGHRVNAGMASSLSRDFSYYPQYSNDDYAPRVPLSKGEVLQSQQNTLQTRQNALDERQRVLGAKQDVTQAERDATLAEQTRLDEERATLQGDGPSIRKNRMCSKQNGTKRALNGPSKKDC